MLLNKRDIKIETLAAGTRGGQHANKTETGVRATHIKTGINAVCRSSRSQFINKITAFKLLEKKLAKYFYRPKKRKKTKTPKWANEKRLRRKKEKSEIKKGRKFLISNI